ncbi:uncharacterized protein ACN427_004764 isoform 1-T4 [Glossina fuscipes fuscipes]
MVLTNFEMWAADSVPASEVLLELESTARSRHLNPFNPLHHYHHSHHHHQPNLTHLSSNGYYGFSYINSTHDMEMNNNNDSDNNNVDENHNNSVTQDLMGNDVNSDNINNNRRVNTVELPCKKRCLISINNTENDYSNETRNNYQSSLSPSAKRCRYDNDDFTAAQHCNDFFSLPFTQIVTQSCYMDTEESSPTIYTHRQQLQHVRSPTNDETMLNDNNNNNSHNVEKNESLKIQSPHVSNHTQLDQVDQQHRNHHYPHHPQVNHRPQSNQTQQQQHYQGHLHRANRDVNRCMLSHMI